MAHLISGHFRMVADQTPKGLPNIAQGSEPWGLRRVVSSPTPKGSHTRWLNLVKPPSGFADLAPPLSQGSEPWAVLGNPFGVTQGPARSAC